MCNQERITSFYLALGGVPEALFADIRPFYTYIHGVHRVLIGKARHFIPGTLPPPIPGSLLSPAFSRIFFYFLFFSWVPYVLVYDVDDST